MNLQHTRMICLSENQLRRLGVHFRQAMYRVISKPCVIGCSVEAVEAYFHSKGRPDLANRLIIEVSEKLLP